MNEQEEYEAGPEKDEYGDDPWLKIEALEMRVTELQNRLDAFAKKLNDCK